MKKKKNGGFTLVEILIVVVILGILAAIVIPQFTQASTEARESSLASNLQTMRSQIELYKIQHNDDLPNVTTLALFETDMCTKQNNLGPYLQKIPMNPFVSAALTFSSAPGDGTPTADTHWYFNTTDSTLHALDNLTTAGGVAHYDF